MIRFSKLFYPDDANCPAGGSNDPHPVTDPPSEEPPWWSSAEASPAEVTPPQEIDPQPEAPPDPAKTPTPPLQPPPDADDSDPEPSTHYLDASSAPAVCARRSLQGLAVAVARDVGRVRENNQDSSFAMLASLPRENGDVGVGLFIVADGMGGHQGGELASRMAVRTVVNHVLSQLILPALDDNATEALQPLMVSAVQAANQAIWDAAQALGSDMGTTCTAALLVGHSLYIAHVGDSRAYLYEPGGLRPLTTDHSTVGRLIQLGQLDPLEAREHPLRNQLYRTVGQQPHVPVDFIYQPIGQSSHLLLCSDGLWSLVDETTMERTLSQCQWPQDACDELVALANLAGGDDNISAIVVTLPRMEQ